MIRSDRLYALADADDLAAAHVRRFDRARAEWLERRASRRRYEAWKLALTEAVEVEADRG